MIVTRLQYVHGAREREMSQEREREREGGERDFSQQKFEMYEQSCKSQAPT